MPEGLTELLLDPDGTKAARATAAMMAMKKLDIAVLRAAHDAG